MPAYALVFGVLLACGVGLPLPEDVALVTGGYLSFAEAVQFTPMLAVAFAGILAGDFLIFLAGRRYGTSLIGSRWVCRIVTEEKRCRVEGYFARHGEGLVFAARFFPGFRAVTYFVAGASPMAAWRFVLFDGLAACISVPVWMVLGRKLGRHMSMLLVWVERAHLVLLVAGVVVLLGTVLTLLRRSRRAAAVPRFEPATPDSLAGESP